MADYEVWVRSPGGTLMGVLGPYEFSRLSYRRVVNKVGSVEETGRANVLPFLLRLPASSRALRWMGRDTRLEVWRDGRLEMETQWLVQRVQTTIDEQGRRLVEVGAVPVLAILSWRLVVAAVGSSEAFKEGPADDQMKAVVRENLGAAAGIERRLSNWLLVQPDTGVAPSVRLSFAKWTVLRVCSDLARASAEVGTRLYFDVVWASGNLAFRTFIGARGVDRTFPDGASPVVLSAERGALQDVVRTFDYEDETTVVYAAGQGAEGERQVAEVGDTARMLGLPFGRRERLVDARHIADPLTLADYAEAQLDRWRSRRSFSARVASVPGLVYGTHWRWGDRVTVDIEGAAFDCSIDELSVEVSEGEEVITTTLVAEGILPPIEADIVQEETEQVYQQVQRGFLPTDEVLTLPGDGQMITYGRYTVQGRLIVPDGARLVVLV